MTFHNSLAQRQRSEWPAERRSEPDADIGCQDLKVPQYCFSFAKACIVGCDMNRWPDVVSPIFAGLKV
jgi:hypothetical protein